MEEQKRVFKSGNEAAALAAIACDYDVMGYYPISPSTEIAQLIDIEKSNGKTNMHLIPADGEHSSAGICYGAGLSGARVFNATSANGLSYMLEQLPVFSGTQIPMVMDLVTRSVSGPLNIHCEHTDLYSCLSLGWVILCASDPQSVYDLNIIGLKIAEAISMPVIVSYDGYLTSHQKHMIDVFSDHQVVRNFLGEKVHPTNKYIDNNDHPLTIGAHMLPDHKFNNSVLVNEALTKALDVFENISEEYYQISNRKYNLVETYNLDNATSAIVCINSTAEMLKEAIDQSNEAVGLIKPIMLRPFPTKEITDILVNHQNLKTIKILDRADNPGYDYGQLAMHIMDIITTNNLDINTSSIIFGLGGKEISLDELITIIKTDYPRSKTYFGTTHSQGVDKPIVEQQIDYDPSVYKVGGFDYQFDEETKQLNVKTPPLKNLMKKPKRISSGHSACPGCGIFPGVELFLRGIEGDVVVLNQTGCAYVVTANYPYSSHKGHYIHNLFQNGAATLSGLVDAIFKLKDEGKINFSDDTTFVMLSGDGGFDIGMGSAIGTALRGHHLIMLEYDNEGYMNTGAQLSYATPLGHRTSTSNVGSVIKGKTFNHKDTVQIMAGTDIPYIFTGVDAFPQDLIRKAAKAQWYAKNVGTVYGKLLITCPLNWKSKEEEGGLILEKAVNCDFFPLYEIENGITHLTYDPHEVGNDIDVSEWLDMMYKSKHLLKPENKELLEEFRSIVNQRFTKLKAKSDHPLL